MVVAVSADIVKPKPLGAGIELPAIIGKLPAHGDFIARGVFHSERERLDSWMAGWIDHARSELGDGFDDAYLSAPPWLFESERLTAVLIPSVDAVGRRFPALALADPNLRTQSVYDALVAALEEGQGSDELRATVSSLECGIPGEPMMTGEWFLPEGAQSQLPSPSDVDGWADVKEFLA